MVIDFRAGEGEFSPAGDKVTEGVPTSEGFGCIFPKFFLLEPEPAEKILKEKSSR